METWSGSQLAIKADRSAQAISALAKMVTLARALPQGIVVESEKVTFEGILKWQTGLQHPSFMRIMAKVAEIDKLVRLTARSSGRGDAAVDARRFFRPLRLCRRTVR
jgi:hypothetical protein